MTKLTCVACGTTRAFASASPAAPILTACQSAGKEGWSYIVGFMSMMTGDHQPRCKECVQAHAAPKTGVLHEVFGPTEID